MGHLQLPEGAEGAFRIETRDAFDATFSINFYGAKRRGWFVASRRGHHNDADTGLCQLPKGEWPTLLHLIDHCGFWALPESGSHFEEPPFTVDDGEWFTLSGRIGERYHRIERFIWREQGLDAVLAFGWRISGFYIRHPIAGWVPRERLMQHGISEVVEEPSRDPSKPSSEQ